MEGQQLLLLRPQLDTLKRCASQGLRECFLALHVQVNLHTKTELFFYFFPGEFSQLDVLPTEQSVIHPHQRWRLPPFRICFLFYTLVHCQDFDFFFLFLLHLPSFPPPRPSISRVASDNVSCCYRLIRSKFKYRITFLDMGSSFRGFTF